MSVVYLYGFVPATVELPADGLLGVGDAVVELLPVDDFAAAIGRLDPDVYGEEALESRTSDMTWMAEQGLRHEQVAAWFVDHASIVPSRLLTLFTSPEAVRQSVAGREEEIRSDLQRFAESREWDVKVAYDPDRLGAHLGEVSEEVGQLDREIAEASPGKRFLLERKRKDVARRESRSAARRLAAELLDELEASAEERLLLPQPEQDTPVVLNAALLLPRSEEDAIRSLAAERATRLQELGVTVEFSGPWAPYRFTGGADD